MAKGACDSAELTTESIEKKVRAVEKKIRQVMELREMKAGGKQLEANQLEKISEKNERALQDELAGWKLKIEEVQKAGMWR
mmetsp:Transcript_58748/g.97022  ORF Transcript_58748/g.97022 Transcript_58748/m.97022 type:complete len:81 (-) Transcript_58748:45-287(-)